MSGAASCRCAVARVERFPHTKQVISDRIMVPDAFAGSAALRLLTRTPRHSMTLTSRSFPRILLSLCILEGIHRPFVDPDFHRRWTT
jgi:hypothetical protein